MDITEFLNARYDEEQQLAEAAAKDASPRFNVDGTHWRSSDGEYISCEEATLAVGPYGYIGDAFANHVVAHDPARVLADLAAKRQLLAVHKVNVSVEGPPPPFPAPGTNYQEGRITYWCNECDHDRDYGHIDGPDEGCRTIRLLAASYADHPDFEPKWTIAEL